MKDAIPADEMTPRERMTAFARGEQIDRLPCLPLISDHASRLIGETVSRCSHSARLMVEAQLAAFRRYRPDGLGIGPGLFGVPEAMGTRLKFPEDGMPYVEDPILKDYSDLGKLPPADPWKDGRLPLYLEALKILNDQIGSEVVVGGYAGGPFTAAGALRGTDRFLRDLHREPAMVHHLLQLATQSILNYIDAVCDLGLKPGLGDPTASGSLISARMFREFAKPYLKQCADRIIERCGSGPTLHICGDTSKIWTDMVDTGAAILSLDNVIDLEEAKRAVGHRVCLEGNVRPVDTLMKGTREQVLQEAKECIRKTYDSPKGYILASGCGLPWATPPENVIALMDAARLYGRIPIHPSQWE